MSQIQLRDIMGRGIPLLNVRLALGRLDSNDAYDDRFTDLAGNTAWPNPLPSADGYSLHINDKNVDLTYKAVRVWTATLDLDLPITVGYTPLPHIHVEKQRFFTDRGDPWFMKGVTAFRLYDQYLAGEDIVPQLTQARDLGANTMRVFGMFHWINVNEFGRPAFRPQDAPDYFAALPAFLQLCNDHGMYVYWSAFPDNDLVMPSELDKMILYGQLIPILEAAGNVIFELTNEQDAHSFNRVDAAKFVRPAHMASCAGSYGDTGGAFPGPHWDFLDFHTPRSYPKGIKDCCVADAPDFMAGKAFLLGEPDRFGWLGNLNAEQARMAAGTALGTTLGIVFHSKRGLRGEMFDHETMDCATAFFDALDGR